MFYNNLEATCFLKGFIEPHDRQNREHVLRQSKPPATRLDGEVKHVHHPVADRALSYMYNDFLGRKI